MTVLIAILKIIGMILLLILGIVAFLILLTLFFPVGYSVLGISEEDVVVRGKIYWLFHLITVCFFYERKEFSSEIRICGIRFKKKEPKLTDVYDEYEIENETEDAAENNTESVTENAISDEIEPFSANTPKDNMDRKSAKNTITQTCKNIKHNIYRFRKALRNMKKKGKEWMEIFAKEENKATMSGVLGELKYLLKHFGIRRIRSNLAFSTGDPATTGQVLGGLCLLPFLYQKGVQVHPDFEADEFYVKGELEVFGHVRSVHILRSGIHLWKDKNLRKIINSIIK